MTSDDPLERLEAETAVPPIRRAVPAVDLPPLQAGQLVTVGSVDNRWWLLDELMVDWLPGERSGVDPECYGCIPWPEQGAGVARVTDTGQPALYSHQWLPARRLWVYVDSPSRERTADELPTLEPDRWTDQLMDGRLGDGMTPPPVLRPRPARELPSLCGKRIRAQMTFADGLRWEWGVALSDPIATVDMAVPVVPLRLYGPLMYDRMPKGTRPFPIPLHRLWTY